MTTNIALIVSAIWTTEGGAKTTYPYGIKCHRHNVIEAKRMCENTVRHALRNWNGQGSFIYFLADRYCPPSVDKIGNQRWKKNMTSILKGAKK